MHRKVKVEAFTQHADAIVLEFRVPKTFAEVVESLDCVAVVCKNSDEWEVSQSDALDRLGGDEVGRSQISLEDAARRMYVRVKLHQMLAPSCFPLLNLSIGEEEEPEQRQWFAYVEYERQGKRFVSRVPLPKADIPPGDWFTTVEWVLEGFKGLPGCRQAQVLATRFETKEGSTLAEFLKKPKKAARGCAVTVPESASRVVHDDVGLVVCDTGPGNQIGDPW